MDEKLERALKQATVGSERDIYEMQEMKEERLSTERCLQIGARLSEHIAQIQLIPERGDRSSGTSDSNAVPEMIVNQGLQQCKESLTSTALKLEKHIQDIMDRMFVKSKLSLKSEEDLEDLTRLRDEWKTTRQCIDICSQADKHLKEIVSTVDNYGTGDAAQFMVSTTGQVIHGKDRGLGWRTSQVGGNISDESLQQSSQDMTSIKFQRTNDPDLPSADKQQMYSERYGRGYQLTPKSSLDETTISMNSSDGKLPRRTVRIPPAPLSAVLGNARADVLVIKSYSGKRDQRDSQVKIDPLDQMHAIVGILAGLSPGDQKHDVEILVDWDLKEFYDKELSGHHKLGGVLTVSGSAANAIAISCDDYLERTWKGLNSSRLLNLIQDSLSQEQAKGLSSVEYTND
jgi:hypothetical protein